MNEYRVYRNKLSTPLNRYIYHFDRAKKETKLEILLCPSSPKNSTARILYGEKCKARRFKIDYVQAQ